MEAREVPGASEIILSYLAGFFDGEGCFNLGKQPSYSGDSLAGISAKICVTNTDLRPLELFQNMFGGKISQKRYAHDNYKDCYEWYMHGKKAGHAVNAMLPFLFVKRQQAEAFLVVLETMHSRWKLGQKANGSLTPNGRRLRKAAINNFRQTIQAQSGRARAWAVQ